MNAYRQALWFDPLNIEPRQELVNVQAKKNLPSAASCDGWILEQLASVRRFSGNGDFVGHTQCIRGRRAGVNQG